MLGAIAGDIIGSIYEARPIKTTEFPLFAPGCRFTDDTVLTVAVAEHLLDGSDLVETVLDYFWRYPDAGFGQSFFVWARSGDRQPYGSWGNGSAMRVSPVGFAAESLEEALREAARTAAITHDHPDGVAGAQAVAAAVYLARQGESKAAIRRFVEEQTGYDLSVPVAEIRPHYRFDISCAGSVPPAIRAFLDSADYEEAVRLAISLGGDADTQACIAGGIAQAFYGCVPEPIAHEALALLDVRMREVVEEFAAAYEVD